MTEITKVRWEDRHLVNLTKFGVQYCIEDNNNAQIWYLNGKLHRLDGPARIFPDDSKEWYINGKHHRTDGPAFIGSDGRQEWWINGTNITIDVNNWIKKQNVTWPWNDDIQIQFLLTFGN